VLLSWAVPKGMPTDTARIRLAIRVEDPTPVDGEGAVKVSIWDRGAYGAKSFSEDEKVVVLRGERLEGSYAIFRTRDGNWLIHRMVSQT
jgi:bifunctional non-homologous end joining protein LigD